MFYLVNNEIPVAMSLMKKMADQGQPGALIPCTKEEIDSWHHGDFIPVAMTNTESSLVEVDPNKSYILFADNSANLDDVAVANNNGLSIDVIRVDK